LQYVHGCAIGPIQPNIEPLVTANTATLCGCDAIVAVDCAGHIDDIQLVISSSALIQIQYVAASIQALYAGSMIPCALLEQANVIVITSGRDSCTFLITIFLLYVDSIVIAYLFYIDEITHSRRRRSSLCMSTAD
jgi:hypothetical protein